MLKEIISSNRRKSLKLQPHISKRHMSAEIKLILKTSYGGLITTRASLTKNQMMLYIEASLRKNYSMS